MKNLRDWSLAILFLGLISSCTTQAPLYAPGSVSSDRAVINHTKSGRLFVNEREIPSYALEGEGSDRLVEQRELVLSELDRLHRASGLKSIEYVREEGTEAFLPIELAAAIQKFSDKRGIKIADTQFIQDGFQLGPFFVPVSH